MKTEPKTISRETYPLQLTKEHLKALAKEHAVDVLEALTNAENGLQFRHLHFEVVKTSGTSGILKSLINVGLISKDNDLYHITDDGSEALKLCQPILELGGS